MWLSYTTPKVPLTPCGVPEKTKEPVPRKRLNRSRQTLYDPSGHDQESYKRVSQLRGINTTQLSIPD